MTITVKFRLFLFTIDPFDLDVAIPTNLALAHNIPKIQDERLVDFVHEFEAKSWHLLDGIVFVNLDLSLNLFIPYTPSPTISIETVGLFFEGTQYFMNTAQIADRQSFYNVVQSLRQKIEKNPDFLNAVCIIRYKNITGPSTGMNDTKLKLMDRLNEADQNEKY